MASKEDKVLARATLKTKGELAAAHDLLKALYVLTFKRVDDKRDALNALKGFAEVRKLDASEFGDDFLDGYRSFIDRLVEDVERSLRDR